MAKSKGSNPYNEGGSLSSETPDSPDLGGYTTYSEAGKMQLSQEGASMVSTPNSESGAGVMGGPAPGEPQVAGMSTNNKSK